MSDKRDEGASAESVTAVERRSAGTHEEGPGPLPEGTVLAGRYEVRKLIGRGGMGVVVEAFDAAVGVLVAIKVVRAEYAGERQWSERLAREVKLARKIQHPNVCRVFDFAQSDGRALLIMELASGGTLRSQLLAGGARARPLGERLADARAIVAGVAAIHAAGIVHRDLSPQNVLRMADGRAVVSDFGLATDTPDGTTSIHGGTVAYMAPEVLRGGRASFAADMWSLGGVIHEVVFGERLRWDPTRAVMRSEVAAASLTRAEWGILEICRACTAPNPERRPRDAGEIAARLSGAGLARVSWPWWRRRVLAAAAVGLMTVGMVAGGRRVQSARRRPTEAHPASDPLMIVPTGEPTDLTSKARVLAAVPEKIRCMVVLPDRHTVRFVWGYPARAEDVDTYTGERKPSPLVMEAYAEGCPDLSPDGKRLVYTGHTRDDRAFAFVSTHKDGRDAVPEVPINEPSMNSDPVWLPDGDGFVYELDDKYVAVFSMTTKRSLILPIDAPEIMTSLYQVTGGRAFVTSVVQAGYSDVAGFDFPRVSESVHFRIADAVLDLQTVGDDLYYGVTYHGLSMVLVRLRPETREGRFVGEIAGQSLRNLRFLEGGLALTSNRLVFRLIVRQPGAEPVELPVEEGVWWASKCGDRIIATRGVASPATTVWLSRGGKVVAPVAGGDAVFTPRCSVDGRTIFWARFGNDAGIQRCDDGRCRTIFEGVVGRLALSTDARRIAFLSVDNRGQVVRWISADGRGPPHELGKTDTGCMPIWASGTDVWAAFRKGRNVIWREIDTDTGQLTGRSFPGIRDCADGFADPGRPLRDPVEIEINHHSQLRVLRMKDLPAS